ncbi:hypothetical protein QBL02_12065 [Leucobacter sp. UT-8R-CII-1-4]|uniref:hypothetical protein n=1 Tax=Leucobacter sp. UT-8R-CII-1-4 TaxID=3040075 RepID=UPI0024A7D4EA|nr:hypothetical protein [Leucobacter sp. UT-8R-CII-1-4]MDI6024276.1 hypothetical protein [Leucobacter sp. UT-8R-CII-1-4]
MIYKAAPSSTRAPDPRPARTRAAILSAIERLGREGKELSVSQVVSEASLSRSSFYSQFTDIGNVAVQLFREFYEQSSPASELLEQPQTLAEATTTLLTEFNSKRYLYAAVLGSSAAVSAEWEVCEIIANAWTPIIAKQAPTHVSAEFAAVHLASGHLACIVTWLRSEKPASFEEIETQLHDMLPAWVEAATV